MLEIAHLLQKQILQDVLASCSCKVHKMLV